jgi:hypothetical protein
MIRKRNERKENFKVNVRTYTTVGGGEHSTVWKSTRG